MEALSTFFPRVREAMRVIEDTFCDPCDLAWQKFSAFLKSPLRKKDYERGRAFGMASYHQNPSAYRADILALKHLSRIFGHCNKPALLVYHLQASI